MALLPEEPGRPIQEVALGLGSLAPQGATEKGDGPGRVQITGGGVEGTGGRFLNECCVALLQGPSSHRCTAAARPMD